MPLNNYNQSIAQSDDSIIGWNQNSTLRQLLIVISLMVVWLTCDLTIHALSHQGIDQLEFWQKLQLITGFNLSHLLLPWVPTDSWRLHLYTAYSLPAIGFIILILLDRLANQGKTQLPWLMTVCGGLFIVGGAILDMAVTVAHSPNLELEGNPYVRILLDSQHSLTFVYIHALFTQSLYITLFCGVWIGFLRHRQILVDTIASASPGSWWEFLKAATGGAHLSTRQWLFPIRPSEGPLLYHYLWLIAVPIVFGIRQLRSYAAMEWLGVVEPTSCTRLLVVLHGVFSALVLYLMFLWRMYRQSVLAMGETRH